MDSQHSEQLPKTIAPSSSRRHALTAVTVDLSRREVLLRVGAGGLAAALGAKRITGAAAQEATPAANELVEVEPLAAIPLEQLPPGPVTLELTRITLLPGFSSPPDAHGVLEIAHVESGTMICPGGEGRTVYGPDGTVTASGAGDLPVPAGSTIVVPPDAPDGARNEGTEPVPVLFIHIGPREEEATPAATPGM
jgi:quercetin dioxygenase-like cupin family protein